MRSEKAGYDKGEKAGRAEGEKSGLARGAAQEKREIAKSMKAKGLEIAMIAELTGLTPEEIAEL